MGMRARYLAWGFGFGLIVTAIAGRYNGKVIAREHDEIGYRQAIQDIQQGTIFPEEDIDQINGNDLRFVFPVSVGGDFMKRLMFFRDPANERWLPARQMIETRVSPLTDAEEQKRSELEKIYGKFILE